MDIHFVEHLLERVGETLRTINSVFWFEYNHSTTIENVIDTIDTTGE
jgi:hypothetical protein